MSEINFSDFTSCTDIFETMENAKTDFGNLEPKKISNFSIDAILASEEHIDVTEISHDKHREITLPEIDEPQFSTSVKSDRDEFSWLQCTRFRPPKLPRSRKKTNDSKRNGRGPRIPFSPYQISILEKTFQHTQYLSSDCIQKLADALLLSDIRVKIWFQNRRARFRREKEHESSPIKIGECKPRQQTKKKSQPVKSSSSLIASDIMLTNQWYHEKLCNTRETHQMSFHYLYDEVRKSNKSKINKVNSTYWIPNVLH